MVKGGWFLVLVLLVLPNCGSDPIPCDPEKNPDCLAFKPGDEPASSAIMCDIEQPVADDVNSCASDAEAADPANVSLTEAATALYDDKHSPIALDWSPAAMLECPGHPKKIAFLSGSFPDGLTLCLNCQQQIPAVYLNPTKACIAKCQDLINFGNGPFPPEGTDAFCEAHARTSTNFDPTICYHGACTEGGNLDLSFPDPRRFPEAVKWIDFDPADFDEFGGSNTIQRTAPATGNTLSDFNKGPASAQTIINGDAWIQFGTKETGLNHVLSLRESCADPVNCPDTDHGLDAIGFAIELADDGNVYVLESDPTLTKLGPFAPPYSVDELFRVRAVDNHNGTATISYARFGACVPGPPVCPEIVFAQSMKPAAYPLRVDTSFREQNATLASVGLMRIRQ